MTADDRTARLLEARDRLAGVIADPDTSARDLAAVSREYRLVLAELAELGTPQKENDVVDQLASRRKAVPGA